MVDAAMHVRNAEAPWDDFSSQEYWHHDYEIARTGDGEFFHLASPFFARLLPCGDHVWREAHSGSGKNSYPALQMLFWTWAFLLTYHFPRKISWLRRRVIEDIANVRPAIDTAAVAPCLSDESFRTWAGEQRVFISSAMVGLRDERRAVADAIRQAGARPVYFENLGGRDDDAEGSYLGEIAKSSVYIGIMGPNYGKLRASRLSATHTEYREAERQGLRISVWADEREDFQCDQVAFVEEIRLFHTTGSYTCANDLAEAVTARLRDMAAEDLAPWVKIGNAMFRAQSVADDGDRIALSAVVRSPSVVTALEELRPGRRGVRRQARLTYNGRSRAIRVLSVVTCAKTSRDTGVVMELERVSDSVTSTRAMSMTFNGQVYSANDVTEIVLRGMLSGQPAPPEFRSFGGNLGASLSQLLGLRLAADIRNSVGGLLLTEALIASGRASHVTQVRIGTHCADGHRVHIAWISRDGEERNFECRWLPG